MAYIQCHLGYCCANVVAGQSIAAADPSGYPQALGEKGRLWELEISGAWADSSMSLQDCTSFWLCKVLGWLCFSLPNCICSSRSSWVFVHCRQVICELVAVFAAREVEAFIVWSQQDYGPQVQGHKYETENKKLKARDDIAYLFH